MDSIGMLAPCSFVGLRFDGVLCQIFPTQRMFFYAGKMLIQFKFIDVWLQENFLNLNWMQTFSLLNNNWK